MTVFVVETYMVKPEKQGEFKLLMQRFLEHKEENPEKFREMKPFKLFSQMFGGITGAYVAMEEFDNMADAEKFHARFFKDEEFIKLYQEFVRLIEPTTYSKNIWKAVE